MNEKDFENHLKGTAIITLLLVFLIGLYIPTVGADPTTKTFGQGDSPYGQTKKINNIQYAAAVVPSGYVYPFYVFYDPYNHDPTVTIVSYKPTNYHVDYYNQTSMQWEQVYPLSGNKYMDAGELDILTEKNTGAPTEDGTYRVVSDNEVGINVLTLEGSSISALSTSMLYNGTEFIFLGNAKGTYGITLHSSYLFRVGGVTAQDSTRIDVYSKVKPSPSVTPNVTEFNLTEPGWNLERSYTLNADEVFDTGTILPTGGASGDDIIAIKIVANKSIVAFRISNDNDELDQFSSSDGTQFGKQLYFGATMSSPSLQFNVYNRETASASTSLYYWNTTISGWTQVDSSIVPSKSMFVYSYDKPWSLTADFWKVESDTDVAVTYGYRSYASSGSDSYWSVPAISDFPSWNRFVTNVIYPQPVIGMWAGGSDIFLATSGNTDIDVSRTAATPALSGTFYYISSGNSSIVDNGLEVPLTISSTVQSILVTNITKFKLEDGTVLIWGISPQLNWDSTDTTKLWTFTGTNNFRYYKGGSGNCWILSINPTMFEAPQQPITIGNVTGGGWIPSPKPVGKNSKATFGFVAHYIDGAAIPSGNLQYNDDAAGLKLHGNVTTLSVDKTTMTATFSGAAKVNGVDGYEYKVTVVDNGEPGKTDTFAIDIFAIPYTGNGTLGGGNIQIHES